MSEEKKVLQAAVSLMMDGILGIIQSDPHVWGTRYCSSCKTISGFLGKPFGCYKWQEDRNKAKEKSGL